VNRVLDAALRRKPFRDKVCVGVQTAEVRRRVAAGTVGHVGLLNSALFLAERFGWPVERAVQSVKPVASPAKGVNAGLEEEVKLFEGKRLRVHMHLLMAAGAGPEEDRVLLDGDPPLEAVFAGGLHGDACTVGQIANLVGRVSEAKPGVRSVAEVPLPRMR
jgi:4-hydroxy-tetrahydrodipicolinate reductase